MARGAFETRSLYCSQHKMPKGRQLLALVPWPGKFKACASGIISFLSLVTGGLPQSRHHDHLPGKKKWDRQVASAVSFSIIRNTFIPATATGIPPCSTGENGVTRPSLAAKTRKTNVLHVWRHIVAPDETGIALAKKAEMDARQVESLSQGPRSRPGN